MNGPYIKDKNSKNKIMYNILISLIPFILYKFYLTGLEGVILLLISILSSIFASIIFDIIKKSGKYKFNFENYLYSLIIGVLINLFIPHNTPILLIIISSFLGILINKVVKNLNPIFITGLPIFIYFMINQNNILELDINIFILGAITMISLLYLIFSKSIKFRISLIFLLVSLLSLIVINFNLNNIFLAIILGIYIIPELYSTPNTAIAGIIYALINSIAFIILPISYFILFALIMNIFEKYLDLVIAFQLANNN